MVLSYFKDFPSIKRFGSKCCDDWVDRLSHVYTVMMLLIFAVVVSTAHFVGETIRCWIPAEFNKDTQSFERYILHHCWIKNTYHIPMLEAIPTNVTQREDEEISYYQWIPLVLLLLALFFKLPHVIWALLHNSSGLNLHKVCSMAQITCKADPQEQMAIIYSIAASLKRWIKYHQQYKNTKYVRIRAHLSHMCGLCPNNREGTFLTSLYLFTKLLYLANVVGQILVLNAFLSSGSGIFALEWLSTVTSGSSSSHFVESQRFPRVTLCDFNIRQLNNVHRHTVQCVLPINLFNEKFFLFLWFWFCFVAMVTIINFGIWFYLIQRKENNYIFVKKYLRIGGWTSFSKSDCKKFANEYLRSDGCFVLRMIGKNSSDLVVVDVLKELFTQYLESVQTNKTDKISAKLLYGQTQAPEEEKNDTLHSRDIE